MRKVITRMKNLSLSKNPEFRQKCSVPITKPHGSLFASTQKTNFVSRSAYQGLMICVSELHLFSPRGLSLPVEEASPL